MRAWVGWPIAASPLAHEIRGEVYPVAWHLAPLSLVPPSPGSVRGVFVFTVSDSPVYPGASCIPGITSLIIWEGLALPGLGLLSHQFIIHVCAGRFLTVPNPSPALGTGWWFRFACSP